MRETSRAAPMRRPPLQAVTNRQAQVAPPVTKPSVARARVDQDCELVGENRRLRSLLADARARAEADGACAAADEQEQKRLTALLAEKAAQATETRRLHRVELQAEAAEKRRLRAELAAEKLELRRLEKNLGGVDEEEKQTFRAELAEARAELAEETAERNKLQAGCAELAELLAAALERARAASRIVDAERDARQETVDAARGRAEALEFEVAAFESREAALRAQLAEALRGREAALRAKLLAARRAPAPDAARDDAALARKNAALAAALAAKTAKLADLQAVVGRFYKKRQKQKRHT